MPEPGAMESEFGVPIPGRILPESEWARTAIKRLPPPGPLDWSAIFGRTAPVVLELGCGNGRFTLLSALARPEFDHVAIDVLPVVIRYATRRANQRGLHNVRFAVKDAETFMAAYVAESSVAEVHLYHPQPYPRPAAGPPAAGHATVPGRRPPRPRGPAACSWSRPTTPTTGRTSRAWSPSSSTSASTPGPGPTPPKAARGARSWRGAGACGSSGAPASAATTSPAKPRWRWPSPCRRRPSAAEAPGATSIATIDREDDSGRGRGSEIGEKF